jgi:hypothetical protein
VQAIDQLPEREQLQDGVFHRDKSAVLHQCITQIISCAVRLQFATARPASFLLMICVSLTLLGVSNL